MLMTLEAASALITDGKLLHIAGAEALIQKLPKGNWIGGSTEYFMAKEGGKVTDDMLFVTAFPYDSFKIASYGMSDINNVATDAFDNGFSIVIVPFDSAVHKEYAENAAVYEGMFIKNIVGWVSGVNLSVPGQTPIVVDGKKMEVFKDRAIALHLSMPEGKTVSINMINIFEQDANAPIIEFTEEGFSAVKCLVDGKEIALADYIEQNAVNTKLPLVGDYSGNGVNISFKTIENGVVNFYAPVFSGVKYRMAKDVSDYANEFNSRLAVFKNENAVFSCNCILNFLYGELEGKSIETFNGPITFGEIAYQLVNQTLVYVTVTE